MNNHMRRIRKHLGPDSKARILDGYDSCVAGVLERHGMEPVIVYDKERVLQRLVDDGMTKEEAVEFFDFNQLGAWAGEGTPAFITTSGWIDFLHGE